MKHLSLSTFLTITALSVAGLVSHSSAQQGPPATQPPAQGPSATQPPGASCTAGAVPADHGRLSTGGVRAGRRKNRRWARGRLRPSYPARDCTAAQSFQSLTAGRSANRSCLQSAQSKLWESQRKPAGSNPARHATRARRLLEDHRCAREGQIMLRSLWSGALARVTFAELLRSCSRNTPSFIRVSQSSPSSPPSERNCQTS